MATNYRKKYKSHYGIDFSSDYDIHHIDLNHENNDIGNLLLLPKRLHARYHFLLNSCRSSEYSSSVIFDAKIRGNAVNGSNYQNNALSQLICAVDECNKWYDYKLYLDGLLPNIHGIELI